MATSKKLRALEALAQLCPQHIVPERKAKSKSDRELWSEGGTWWEGQYLWEGQYFGQYRHRHLPRRPLIEALIAGTWHATGRRVPATSPPEPIPTDLWGFLKIDYEANTASGGGLEYVDLWVQEAEPADAGELDAKDGDGLGDVGERRPETEPGPETDVEPDRFEAWADEAIKMHDEGDRWIDAAHIIANRNNVSPSYVEREVRRIRKNRETGKKRET